MSDGTRLATTPAGRLQIIHDLLYPTDGAGNPLPPLITPEQAEQMLVLSTLYDFEVGETIVILSPPSNQPSETFTVVAVDRNKRTITLK